MSLGKGIPLINGFDLNSKLPLDSRAVADTIKEMNALVANGSASDGQLCYCKEDKKLYILKDSTWSEVGNTDSSDYKTLKNKPTFNGVAIDGDKTDSDYGINSIDKMDLLAVLDMKEE